MTLQGAAGNCCPLVNDCTIGYNQYVMTTIITGMEAADLELLKMEHIHKSFFGVKVLDDVSLTIRPGKVHALLGENGAGKSTLMNILSGIYTRDEGTVTFEGKELPNGSISASENAGIAFVHQELNIFNDLEVYENLFLGKEITGFGGKLDKKAMISEAEKLFAEMGVPLQPRMLAGDLVTGAKQVLEIAKALYSKAKLIILDEPTTALSNNEIEHFFGLIRSLKEKGTAFIFISHKMPEIFSIADEYTVLRNARFISSGQIKDATPLSITRDMVGETYANEDVYVRRELGDVLLQADHLSGTNFSDVSFSCRKGEILGFTGLQGAGCSEVLQTIFGALPIQGGSLMVSGETISQENIHKAMTRGIGMIPANRKENSVIPDMTLLENTYISRHTIDTKNPSINKKNEQTRFDGFRNTLNIKANRSDDLIVSLSGGNQQKIILARWLDTDAQILLMDNPTQGIDVGAKEEIYRLILKLAESGKTIIVNTLEIPELKKIADRCIVFYHGKIAADLPHAEIEENKVMMYSTGAL